MGPIATHYAPRRCGQLKADALSAPPVSELAPDAWKALPDLATFTGALQGCGLPIKALLLDQNKASAGRHATVVAATTTTPSYRKHF